MTGATLDDGIVRQAAEWLVRLSDDASESVQADFQAWQASDPRHAAAVARISALIGDVGLLRETGKAGRSALNAVMKPPRRVSRSRIAAGAVLAVVLSVSLLFGLQLYPPVRLMADISTGTGERKQQMLDDRSQLTLNSGSAVKLHFDASTRRIELLSGEIMVDVASDPARPFLVETEHGLVRALGTRFIVRSEGELTRLYMLESRTAVQSDQDRRSGLEARQVVTAGQSVAIRSNGVSGAQDIDAQGMETAWERHQLVVQDQPLGEVLDELSRHRNGVIIVSDAVRDLRVSAVLPLDDTDRALLLLSTGLPVRTSTLTPWLVRVDAAARTKKD